MINNNIYWAKKKSVNAGTNYPGRHKNEGLFGLENLTITKHFIKLPCVVQLPVQSYRVLYSTELCNR